MNEIYKLCCRKISLPWVISWSHIKSIIFKGANAKKSNIKKKKWEYSHEPFTEWWLLREREIACCQLRASIIWFPSNSLNRFISAGLSGGLVRGSKKKGKRIKRRRSDMTSMYDVCAGQISCPFHCTVVCSQYLLKWLANRKMTMIIIDKRHVLTRCRCKSTLKSSSCCCCWLVVE